MAEIDVTRFEGTSQKMVGNVHETITRKVCGECHNGDSLLVFQWVDDPDEAGWRDGCVRCTECGHRKTETFPPNYIRTRLTIQL